jgi:ceramide glucosyltransferase
MLLIILGEKVVGVNPKINNLINGYESAKYDLVWICDSNVFVEPDTLSCAIAALEDSQNVGLVHHAPEGMHAQSFGALLEQMFLNTAHTKIYLVINWLAVDSCIIGKSIIFRRSDLARSGGLESLSNYLAEDNMIGIELLKMVGRSSISLIHR